MSVFCFQFHQIFFQGSIDNKSALIQVMVWHQTADKSLSEPMMTKFYDMI